MSPELELLAGNIGGPGNTDGIGVAARFNSPAGVAVASSGDVYVADTSSSTIRKIAPSGVVTTVAGVAGVAGSTNGDGGSARFAGPSGVAVDDADNLYVADYINYTIRKITPAGIVTTLAGTANNQGTSDGTGAAARFTAPACVAVDSTGNVYVTDDTVIRKITSAGVVTTLAGTPGAFGSTDGTGTAARFSIPQGIAVDDTGNLYVVDTGNDTIRKITPTGVVTTLAGAPGMAGSTNGISSTARFFVPTGVAVDGVGNVYVSDTSNQTIRKIDPSGRVTTFVGAVGVAGSTDGGVAARFHSPEGLASDSAGNIYVADSANNAIRKITPAAAVTTIAGAAGIFGNADGVGPAAQFNSPLGVTADDAGNVYVADRNNQIIRKVTSEGVVTTLAGTKGATGSVDGAGTAAQFADPEDLAVDDAGNMYVADTNNATLRKVTSEGVVTTLAGTAGKFGSTDGSGAAAQFNVPSGVAVDSTGNLYVADSANDTLRKVTLSGVVTTLAGVPDNAGSSDGGGTARFDQPTGVATDRAGNVYVADDFNNTIREVSPEGIVTTLAGTPGLVGSTDGSGAAALFNRPQGVAVDHAGNVYVADTGNGMIRKIAPGGVTTTIGGLAGASGVALGAVPRFTAPQRLAIVGDSLVISDENAILLFRHVVQ